MSQPKDRNNITVTLFPFLAVLICMMGALIVLLVIVVQQARAAHAAESLPAATEALTSSAVTDATEEPARVSIGAQSPPGSPDIAAELAPQERLEDLRLQIKQLESSRETTRGRVREQQLQLSLAEDQLRILSAQLDRLEKEAQQLEMAQSERLSGSSQIDDQLAALRAQCETLSKEVNEVRENGAKKAKQFALIPYKGSNGTNRRPIYVECLEDRAVLQPEGIVFTEEDFPSEIGTDNPLAVALRATREYWLNHRVAESSGDAYPLLIVRPTGAHMYAACRAALRGWDEEFGYELVSSDIQLAYAKSDPSLSAYLQQSVDEARLRLRPELASSLAAPSYGGQPFGAQPYGAAPSGRGSESGDSTGGNGAAGGGPAGKGANGSGTGSGNGTGNNAAEGIEQGGNGPDSVQNGASSSNPGPNVNSGPGGSGVPGGDSSAGPSFGAPSGGSSASGGAPTQAISADSVELNRIQKIQKIAATRGENWRYPTSRATPLPLAASLPLPVRAVP